MLNACMEMLETNFKQVLLLSVMGSVLILVTLVIRLGLKKVIRPGWMYLLWLPLLLRLLIPWSSESPLNLYSWIPSTWGSMTGVMSNFGEQSLSDPTDESAHVVSNSDRISPIPVTEVVSSRQVADRTDTSSGVGKNLTPTYAEPALFSKAGEFGWLNALSLFWLIGLVWIVTITLRSSLTFKRRLWRASKVHSADIVHLQARLEECCKEMGVRRIPKLVVTDEVSVPTVFGAWRPQILIPSGLLTTFEDRQFRYVLLHELAHIKRRDIAVNLLFFILTAIHWFNPLMAWAGRKLREDQETACDEWALRSLSSKERKEYGLALITLFERNVSPYPSPLASGLWSGRRARRHRMLLIADYRKNTGMSLAVGMLTVLLLAGCALTGPPNQSEDSGGKVVNPATPAENKPGTGESENLPELSATLPAGSSVIEQVEIPKPGEEGTQVAALNGISVYAAKTSTKNEQGGLQRRFTIRNEDGAASAYLWNYEPGGSNRSVIISQSDVTGDEREELILFVPTGSGTELSLQEAHVLTMDTLEELPLESPVARLDALTDSSIVLRDGQAVLNVELQGTTSKTHMTKRYEDVDPSTQWNEQIGFGALVQYVLAGDTLTAVLGGRASLSEFPLTVSATYDRDLKISNPLLYPSTLVAYDEGGMVSTVGERLGVASTDGWNISHEDGFYKITVPGMNASDGEGASYGVNSLTGTLFDFTSGAPIDTLTFPVSGTHRADAEELRSSNGTVYQAALEKRLRTLADDADWKLVGTNGIEGFDGQGNVLCRIHWRDRELVVSADIFTGVWTEVE